MAQALAPRTGAFDAYQKLAITTIVLTFILIGVGAFVRVSGAGMGCPDWPMCFGLLVPPTTADQLPAGFDHAQFNVVHTWTEYLNRLLGALVGFSILATLVAAVAQHRHRRVVLWSSVGALLAVGYAAWLGARVVAYALAPWSVTIHLFAALVVFFLLLLGATAASESHSQPNDRQLTWATLGVLAVQLLQGALGTQVRGQVSEVARLHPELPRDAWLNGVGLLDIFHRELALGVAFAVVALFFWARARTNNSRVRAGLSVALAATCAQVASGIVLAYADLPRALQIVHLELFSLTAGALWVVLLSVRPRSTMSSDGR